MYGVVEAVFDDKAVIILDSKEEILIDTHMLPKPFEWGDVFLFEKTQEGWVVVSNDVSEKGRRLKENKAKRQALLNRTKKRDMD
ncbi:hypothetical protein [Alkalibacterium sp. MB6]|uniref:hypothetical protein n=1 Tax=Alkalibacterium sp. MB6 TaxID=2081965 RepID=UPI00137B3727|nr:hypothetical protein [Alkalibacterium sp. MB6]